MCILAAMNSENMKNILLATLVILIHDASAQVQRQVLFLGNSYVAVNSLPDMIAQAAHSAGDSLIYQSNTPGGYTFQMHSTNATSLAYIAQGNWDAVVLQEQSQIPSFPESQVITDCFPYAAMLDSLILAANECTETVFYMTWGRQNGDASNCASWPPVCTYEGMDSLLHLRYMQMAVDNNGVVSPVGAVWHYLRDNYPAINLYAADQSHPSVAGSYAAACTFYATLFQKSPLLITYQSSLDAATAAVIREAVEVVVFQEPSEWLVDSYRPFGQATLNTSALHLVTNNTSTFSSQASWDFGDGTTSDEWSPSHDYSQPGLYHVVLTVSNCGMTDTVQFDVNVTVQGLHENHADAVRVGYAADKQEIYWLDSAGEYPVRIKVMDLMGRTVHQGCFFSYAEGLSVASWPRGSYVLLNEESHCRKLFVLP